MRAMINPGLLQTNSDSGSLNLLGRIAHPVGKPGVYLGTLFQGDSLVTHFHVVADASNVLPQTNIDLASLVPGAPGGCPNCPPGSTQAQFSVNPKGYLIFYVSHGTGGFAVTLTDTANPANPVFDSRNLQAGDYYVVNVVGAGQYKVTNSVTQQAHDLEVKAPVSIPGVQFKPLAPLRIQVNAQGFDQAKVQVMALQPKVYLIQSPTRIKIDLTSAAPVLRPLVG